MTIFRPFVLASALSLGWLGYSQAQLPGPLRLCTRNQIENLNGTLAGQVLDYTYNHRVDRRICSASLGEKRDLYVYLPPGYDPSKSYPLMIWMHGFGQDEKNFLDIVGHFDKGMRCGTMPPMIVAVPDGSIQGQPAFFNTGSFYINSKAGRFEDWIMQDVWNFMHANFPILPGKESHVMAGASMGGFGAVNLGIKHRDRVGVVVGLMPPLNIRYGDCNGHYFGDFDPSCTPLDDRLRPNAAVARFYGWYGVYVVRKRRITDPLFGRGPDAIAQIAADNPIEMLDSRRLQPGELQIYVGYGKKDEFNIDAQVESFLHQARTRGIEVTAYVNPNGRHNTETGLTFYPTMSKWLTERVPVVSK